MRIPKHRSHWSMDVEFLMEDPGWESDLDGDGQHAWDGTSAPWNTFLDPVIVNCTLLPFEH